MKKPLVSTRLRPSRARELPGGRRLAVMTGPCTPAVAWLAVLSLLGAACASDDPRLSDVAQPSVPGPGQAQPGTVFGLPGDGSEGAPASSPPVNDGPGATETNFFTPPCGVDGLRLVPDGGASDAGGREGSASSGELLDAGAVGSAMADAPAPNAHGARVPCPKVPGD
jgi:hypothetical protein